MPQAGWLQRYRQLQLVVRRAVATLQAGAHRSIYKGSGLAFEEVRHYQPGDEVRSIDWNVTARMGHPYVKRFVEERELRILFLLDISGSQQTGSGKYLKRDAAAEMIALLCLAGLRHGDSMGLALFSDQIESYVPPGRGMRHVLRLIHQALYREPEHQKTDIAKGLLFANKVIRRRSVVVVFSDFLDQNWTAALERLAHRHEVIVVRAVDPLDTGVPSPGLFWLEDAETNRIALLDQRQGAAILSADQNPSRLPCRWLTIPTDGRHLEQLLLALQAKRIGRR
jgi:uncharacterized protein (DUF58 family)